MIQNYIKFSRKKGKGSDVAFTTNAIINGELVKMVVDDEFSVTNDAKLAFAVLNENFENICTLILEKAWVKGNRSYQDIIPGN